MKIHPSYASGSKNNEINYKEERIPERCGYCVHWRRNSEFPNKLGSCMRPYVPTLDHLFPLALNGASTHESFGCTGFANL